VGNEKAEHAGARERERDREGRNWKRVRSKKAERRAVVL
jgi:hypothetical protein